MNQLCTDLFNIAIASSIYNKPLSLSLSLDRLNLTPTPREKRTRSRTQMTTERTKRPRLDPELSQKSTVSTTAAGYIQISDVDPSGNFVQIKNMSNQVCVVTPVIFFNTQAWP